MAEAHPPPILIAGPTASGKSELALRIAEREGGVVVNADAAQVYSCWRALTARPTAEDEARAPHRLYGHVDGATRHSVGAWLRDLTPLLTDPPGRLVIVGGTGLYLSALTEGLTDIPPIPPEIRARSQALIDSGALDALRAALEREDPRTYAKIDRANPARLQRAWEVLRATGRPLSDWHADGSRPLLDPARAIRIVLNPERAALAERIARRFQAMLAQGALDEVRAFLALGLDPALPAARVLGAPDLIAHLRGETSLAEATEAAITRTRQFAKRQRSWFRGRMADWTWIDPLAGDALREIGLGRPR